MKLFADRQQAGELLARRLQALCNQPNVVVLGLAGGGILVAYPIAMELRAPLDLFSVQPVRLPHFPDLCLGYVTSGGQRHADLEAIAHMHLADEAIEWHFRQATDLMEDSELRIRGRRVAPKVKDQTVILVNDNQNNDSRMTVAREALLRLGAAQVIVAAPIVNSSGAPLPHSIALYSHEKPLTPEQIYEHSIAVLENQERHLILEANASTAVA